MADFIKLGLPYFMYKACSAHIKNLATLEKCKDALF